VQDHHLRAEAPAKVAGEAHRQLGMRAAAHRHEDRADVVQQARLAVVHGDHGHAAAGQRHELGRVLDHAARREVQVAVEAEAVALRR
jgi:hypothetical protein